MQEECIPMYYSPATSSAARSALPVQTPPAPTMERRDGAAGLRPRVLSSAELRELAGQWRSNHEADDAERAEKVARVLEWLANHREPKRRTRLQVVGDRISSWVGL